MYQVLKEKIRVNTYERRRQVGLNSQATGDGGKWVSRGLRRHRYWVGRVARSRWVWGSRSRKHHDDMVWAWAWAAASRGGWVPKWVFDSLSILCIVITSLSLCLASLSLTFLSFLFFSFFSLRFLLSLCGFGLLRVEFFFLDLHGSWAPGLVGWWARGSWFLGGGP